MSPVAALYIDPRGPYPKLLGPEMCWDKDRDARSYEGPWAVVAHPPCGPWSKLAHLSGRQEEKALFTHALTQVQRFGGVLEHPAGSRAFRAHGIQPTLEVQQCDWGHPARKRTWLYLVRCVPAALSLPGHKDPTHWCSGVHTPGARGETPPGIKVCSAQQRRRTPVAFADWLVSLAAQAARVAG